VEIGTVGFVKLWFMMAGSTPQPAADPDYGRMRSRFVLVHDLSALFLACEAMKLRRQSSGINVLEIGTAEGGTTRVLSLMCGSLGSVYSVGLNHLTGDGSAPDVQLIERPDASTYAMHARDGVLSRVRFIMADTLRDEWVCGLPNMDVAFIDGNHSAEAVISDSFNCLRLMPDGGVIVWHDWKPEHRDAIVEGISVVENRCGWVVHPQRSHCAVAWVLPMGVERGKENKKAA
jgi:hypothetical protein